MAGLTQLGSKITSGISTTGNALNLADNILDNDTIVGEFMDMTEGNEFLKSILGGIKDFLHKIGEAYGFLKNLISKILDFVNKILSYLDLNKLFDALGIKYLMDLIVSIVGATLFTGVLGDRQDFISLMQQGCVNIDNDGIDNPFSIYILAGISMTLACSGETNALTLLDLTLKEESTNAYNEEKESINTSLSVIELSDLTGITDQATIDELTAKNLILTAERDALSDRLTVLENKFLEETHKVDLLLSKVIFLTFKNTKPNAVESLLLDMATIPAFVKSKDLSNTTPILGFIDKLKKEDLINLDYGKLKDILHLFDPALISIPTNIISSLARETVLSKPMSITPSDIDQDMLSMIRPTLGDYQPC